MRTSAQWAARLIARPWLSVLIVVGLCVSPRGLWAEQSVDVAAIEADAAAPKAATASVVQSVKQSPKSAIHLVVILALASLAPAIVLTCTCFVRFAVVFSFLRTGLGTQGAPPTQALVGLALFMTAFVMAPIASQIHSAATGPYFSGKMDEKQAIEAGTPPLRKFLLERTRPQDLALFYEVSSQVRPDSPDDVPLRIAIPAYVLSELGTAFRMGLMILLPFLVIELVVAAMLSALGMIMLPPPIVSLPVKLLVFVAVDGWHLVVGSLLKGAV